MNHREASEDRLGERLAAVSTPALAAAVIAFFVVVFMIGEAVIAMVFGARTVSFGTALLHGGAFGLLFAAVAALARGGSNG